MFSDLKQSAFYKPIQTLKFCDQCVLKMWLNNNTSFYWLLECIPFFETINQFSKWNFYLRLLLVKCTHLETCINLILKENKTKIKSFCDCKGGWTNNRREITNWPFSITNSFSHACEHEIADEVSFIDKICKPVNNRDFFEVRRSVIPL